MRSRSDTLNFGFFVIFHKSRKSRELLDCSFSFLSDEKARCKKYSEYSRLSLKRKKEESQGYITHSCERRC